MKFKSRELGKMALLMGLAMVLAGCPKPVKKPVEAETPPVTDQTNAPTDQAAMAPGVDIGTDWVNVPSLAPVYFDTNRGDLKPEGRTTLKKNAAIIKAILAQAPGAMVRVEGHADQRGTVEYNLALGQRRANALKSFYATLGIKKSLLSTISYGEEKPVCTDENENCYWKNRRGETTLKATTAIRIPMDKLPAQ